MGWSNKCGSLNGNRWWASSFSFLVVLDPSSLMGWDGWLKVDMGSKRGHGCCTNSVGSRTQHVGASARSLARCGWTRVASPRRATVATAVAHLQTASARVRLCAVNPSIPISHDSDGRRDRPFLDRPLPRQLISWPLFAVFVRVCRMT